MGVIAAALHQAKLLRESKMAALHHPWGVVFLPLLLLVALHQPGGVALVLVALHLPGGGLLLLVALYQPGGQATAAGCTASTVGSGITAECTACTGGRATVAGCSASTLFRNMDGCGWSSQNESSSDIDSW